MTEQQAKHQRKLNQAINDAIREMPESYSLDQLQDDVLQFDCLYDNNDLRKITRKMIAGLLRWQIDNL